ncbi:MAG TPA: hypothetical protein VFZ77_06960 [Acidimicrobiales bacterium]
MQTLTLTEIPLTIEGEGVEVRTTEVGGMTASYIRLAKGTDLGPALTGLEGDRCQCPHWGYMLDGRLLMRTPTGEHVYEAGQAFYWAPGHVPVALEDAAYVDFSPTEEFGVVLRHIQGGA